MAGKSIGATLVLNAGNFLVNMRDAASQTDKLKQTLSGASGGVKSFSSGISSMGSALSGVVKKVAGAAAAYVSLRSAMNFGKDVVNTGVQFEQGMANVSAISGVTGDELKSLSDKAKEMGATTKFSALEASDAMSYMAMAGWSSSQMIDGIGGIMNLAAASGEELASVSDIVTDSLTAFGLKASDSAEFADILAVASSKSNTNVSLLGESFKNVAPTAGAMGYSVRDTTVALGLMANAGIKGGAAGTALNGVMTRLAKPTKEVSTAMNELGLSAVNADGSMKPLSQFIPELQAKFSTLTDAEKGQYATMIAGKNAMSGFLSIVNSSPEDFQLLTDAINNSEGAAQSMADTMNDTVAGKLTLLKSQFEGVKIAIYDALGSSQFKGVLQSMSDGLTSITPVLETVTVAIGNGLFAAIQGVYNIAMNVFNAVKTAIENNQPAIENLKSAFESIKTSISNIFIENSFDDIQTIADVAVPAVCNALAGIIDTAAGVVNFFSEHWGVIEPIIVGVTAAVLAYKGVMIICATATGILTAAQTAFNIVMSLNPATWILLGIVAAIGAVVAIGVVLYKNWDTIKAKASELWNGIKEKFEGIKNTVVEKFNAVKEKVSGIWNSIKSGIFEKIDNIKSAVSEKFAPIKEAMGNVMEAAKKTVSDKLNNIKSAYEQHGGGIKGAAFAAIEGVKGYYTAGYDFINNLTGGKLGEIVEGVKSKLAPMVNAVKEKLSGVKEAFGSAFSNAIDFIKKSYNEGTLKPIVDKIVNVFGTVKNAIAEKFTGIKEAVSAKFSAISDAANGVKEKIADKFITAKTAISEKFTGIKEAVGVKLTVISDAANGIKEKIAERFTAIKDAVVSKFGEIKTGIQAALEPVANIVSTIVTGIKTVIITIIEGIKTYISNTVNIIKTTISNIVDGVKQNFVNFFTSIQTAFQGVWTGITTIFEGIKTVIVGVFQVIVGVFTLNIETIKTGVNTIKDGFMTAFEGAKTIVLNVWNAISSACQLAFDNVKIVVTNVIDGVKTQIENVRTTVSDVFNNVWSTISTTFENVKTKVSEVFENVKNTISGAIETIKGFFKFDWELPKIKLPHFNISGSFSMNPPSAPSFDVQWYKYGGIMTSPTIFGMNGNRLMAGGEAGAEAILPLNMLWDKLGSMLENKGDSKHIVVNNYITVDGGNSDSSAFADEVADRIGAKVKVIMESL